MLLSALPRLIQSYAYYLVVLELPAVNPVLGCMTRAVNGSDSNTNPLKIYNIHMWIHIQ
jgi:hypothetical protein